MGRSRFKLRENYYPYFITISVVDGIALFADKEVSGVILEALKYLQEESACTLYGYVLMHNHLHMVVEGKNLSGSLRQFKSYTARKIIDLLKERNRRLLLRKLSENKHDHHKDSEYQVWQEGFHPKQISHAEVMRQKIEYIHYNPVTAGFVDNPEYWKNSSAINYSGREGLIPVSIFEG